MIVASFGSTGAMAKKTMCDRSLATRLFNHFFFEFDREPQGDAHAIISPALSLFVSIPGLCSFLLANCSSSANLAGDTQYSPSRMGVYGPLNRISFRP